MSNNDNSNLTYLLLSVHISDFHSKIITSQGMQDNEAWNINSS